MAEDYFQSFGTEHLELVPIARPIATPLADIIFVHGLGGDGLTTWNAGDKTKPKYWPAWLAEDLPEAQIWSLSYPAPKTNWTSGRGRAMPLPSRATSVGDLLTSHGISNRPVMFITHSLGGLLVKQMLRQSAEAGNEKGRLLARQTKAVVFLATPHQGSNLANIAGLLSRISWRAVPFGALFRWSAAIRSLKKDCPHLRDLAEWYKNNARSLGIATLAYYETVPIGPALVVDPTSANPMVEGSDFVAADGNHLTICTPDSRQSAIHLGIRSFLRDKLVQLQAGTADQPAFGALIPEEIRKRGMELNGWPKGDRLLVFKQFIQPFDEKTRYKALSPSEEQRRRSACSPWDLDRILLYVWEKYEGLLDHSDPLIHLRHEFQRMKAKEVVPEAKIPSMIPLYYAVESYEEVTKDRILSPRLKNDLQFMHDYIEQRAPALDEGGDVRQKLRTLIKRCM